MFPKSVAARAARSDSPAKKHQEDRSATKYPLVVLSTLAHIQANLDEDLSLGALAVAADLSPFQFHRAFKQHVGETPKRYTLRLRLERAALQLWLHETTVLETALACGFQSHETFTRAFRRHFGVVPKRVKKEGLVALPSVRARSPAGGRAPKDGLFELSKTRVVTLKPMHVAFIRHVGPYEETGDWMWSRLQSWAREQGLPDDRQLLGIAHDAPGVTPPDKLRFDAALELQQPITGDDLVGCQRLESRSYAVTTHVGPYDTLGAAYGTLAERLQSLPRFRLAGPPTIEMYHENRIDATLSLNHTDIYIAVTPKTRRHG